MDIPTLNNESNNSEEAETVILAFMLCGITKDEAERQLSLHGIDDCLSFINPLIIESIQLKYELSEAEAQKLLKDEGLRNFLEDESFRKVLEDHLNREEEKLIRNVQQTQGVDRREAKQILVNHGNKIRLDALESEVDKLMEEEIIPLWIKKVQEERGISEDEAQKKVERMLKESEARLLSQNTTLPQSQITQNHSISRNEESSYNKILVLVFIIAGIFVAIFFAFCSKTT